MSGWEMSKRVMVSGSRAANGLYNAVATRRSRVVGRCGAPPAGLAREARISWLIRSRRPYLIGEFGSKRMSRYLSTLPISSGISFWKKWFAPGITS